MNQSVYEKNIEMLEKKYPVWAEILKTNTRKKRNFEVIIEESYTNEPIMKVNDHGKVYYLNGKYAPSETANNWLKQQGNIDKFATIIIIGLSNGMHIKKIMESVPKTVNIMVYEPSYEIFRRAMEEVDLSFLFQLDIPVGIVVEPINGFEVSRYFSTLIAYDNLVSLKVYLSGNYTKLFPKETGEFVKELKQYSDELQVGWNTLVRYTNVNARNLFHNLHYLCEGYSVAELYKMLPENVPVIVVSAGPSLNKNIKDLKEAQGKACIIATDTAMKPLLNAGIVPDLFMIVDGLKPAELFEHKDISKTAMVTMTAVSREPMDLHKGRKLFYTSDSPFETELIRVVDAMKDRDVLLPVLPTGGSVATSAYSLGVFMGARTIILVGQDLALTGNKIHVDGAFKDEKCDIDMESGAYVEVEAIGGGKVITRNDFKHYLEWFESTIRKWKHIQTVDATEGGALIHGAKSMTLKKAIKKYCIKDYNVKWHLARLPKLVETAEEEKYILNYFENSVKRLEDVKKKAKEGIRSYEKLQKLSRNSSRSQKEFQKTYKKIKKINTYMEKDEIALTVIDSLKGMESALRPLIYQTKDDRKEEIDEVAEQGKVMLTGIMYGSDEIKGIVEETLIPYVKERRKSISQEAK
ncbi:MAG: DUF115 domain-containing protein [Roseburia sp.]|nr:DUF115 domain-containing protein [Roseburia sp.]